MSAPAQLQSVPGTGDPAEPTRLARLADGAARKPVLVLAIAGLLVGLRRSESPYADGDILWGARAGTDFLSSGRVPHADAYSWTAHGTIWIPNGWGWNVLLGIAYKIAGLAGIAVLGIVAVAGLAVLVGRAARAAGASTAWATLAFMIVAGVFTLFLYPRAQLVDYLAIFVFPLLIPAALFAHKKRAAATAALTVLVQILWMNLHTAAVLGPVLVAALGIGHLLGRQAYGRRRAALARLSGLVAVTAAGCLTTPYGVAPITHLEAVRRASAGLISEWRPAGFASPDQVLGLAALALAAGAAGIALRARRLDTVLVLAALGVATASAIRFAPMAALYAVPELAVAAGRIRVRPEFLSRTCALAMVVLAMFCLIGLRSFARPGVANASPRLVAELPSGCRLLNDYSVGGAVILHRPDVAVSIDSRNDMYGRTAELQSLAVLSEPALGVRYVEAQHVTCVLVQSQAPLVSALEHSGKWRVVDSDGVRSLLTKAAAG
jgi:hypothetical protein